MKIISNHEYISFGPYLAKMDVDLEFCTRLLKLGKTLTKMKQLIDPTTKQAQDAENMKVAYLYDLEKNPWIEEEVKVWVNTWIGGYKQFSENPNFELKFKLNSLWINVQNAGEYNPVHIHPGSTLSFVLYLEVPEEMLKEKGDTRGISPGYTGFMYGEHSDFFWGVSHRSIRPKVGGLLIFPSNLRHYASHFNSKVIRTSVSGNITFTSIMNQEPQR